MAVTVICEKTGIEFEAATKRTKNHPKIMSILNEANKDGWYADAMESIKEGRESGLATIEEYVTLLEQTKEAHEQASLSAFRAQRKAREAAKEARRERAYTNSILSNHGYTWKNTGFADEEEADAFDINATIGTEWHLYSADNREVTVIQAMQEIAAQGSENAKNWLHDRGIDLESSKKEGEKTVDFQLGQHVRVVNAMVPTYATVTGFGGEYIKARLDEGGPEYTYRPEQLIDASTNAPMMLDGEALKVEQAPLSRTADLPDQYHVNADWLCEECGNTWNGTNGKECPTCGEHTMIVSPRQRQQEARRQQELTERGITADTVRESLEKSDPNKLNEQLFHWLFAGQEDY